MAFRWGILGLGSIAHSFANGLKNASGAELYAVGSRSSEKAETFGNEFGAARRYGSYEALAEDPDVDAIYIATPHPSHYADTLLVLNSGKAALTEKSFTVNANQARKLVEKSRKKNVFLMEAMWTRFMPVMIHLRALIAEGAIGKLRLVEVDFGFRADFNAESRLFAPELGGGALLDVGVYAISFASMLLGTPVAVTGLAELGQTGVDEQSAYLFKYPHGELAVLSSAVRTQTAQKAAVFGTEGSITIDSPWWHPTSMTLRRNGSDAKIIAPELIGNGYNYEAAEVQQCVKAGRIESNILPHSESIAIMETMDKLRAQWGLVYPGEQL
jgi:predicted dehydrogenase